MLGTITKAGRVLELFTAERPEWGVTDAAMELDMPKTNAHALLATLREIGLLRRAEHGRYRLGWKLVSLNRVLAESSSFQVAAGKRMQTLADSLNKTMHLAVLVDHDVVYLDKRQGPRCETITQSGIGKKMSAHCTAVGKVLLADDETCTVEELAELRGLPKRTARTIDSVNELERNLEMTRRRGFGLDLQESVPNLCCVAAPIRDRRGATQAAISISAPLNQFRLNPQYYRLAVESVAREVSLSWELEAV